MSTMSFLLHLTSLILLHSCTPGLMVDGIVGGKVSIPHSRPYMVYIRESKSKVCNGFLVRYDYVMTAAHCEGSHLKVYLSVHDTNFLPDGVAVDPIPHPQFKSNTPGHDIMLLKLKIPATLNKTVKTIALPKKENPKNAILKDCMVLGWGLEDYGRGPPSRVLKEENVTLLDSKNCGTPDTLCSEGTTGPAQGDAGGPLVCGDVAQGIVSYYRKESNGEYCKRYTDISQYLQWIHSMDFHFPPPRIQENKASFSVVQDDIVDSDVSIPHSRPFMVYIHDSKSKAVCGDFLVREDFVMTAAHCKGSHLKVYLGVNDTNFLHDGVAVLPFPHPQFKSNTQGHDIMLLKLKTPTNLNKAVRTITLPKNSSENTSKDCMVMSWGLQKSNVLKEVNVTLLDSKNCGTPDTLCSEGTTGPAEGASGSPLVCGDVAQGISFYYKQESNGEHCTRYTDISQYLPWIHHVMNTHPLQKNEISKGKLEEHEEEEHEVIKFNTICLG